MKSGTRSLLKLASAMLGYCCVVLSFQGCGDDYVHPLDIRYHPAEDAYSQQAWQAYAAGELDQAARDFQHALSIQADHADALSGYGWVLLDEGEMTEAQTCFEAALGAEEQNLHAQLGLAAITWQQGQYDQCATYAETSLELLSAGGTAEPLILGLRDVHLMLAQVYYATGEPEKAYEHLEALETQDFSPNSPDFEARLLTAIEHAQSED